MQQKLFSNFWLSYHNVLVWWSFHDSYYVEESIPEIKINNIIKYLVQAIQPYPNLSLLLYTSAVMRQFVLVWVLYHSCQNGTQYYETCEKTAKILKSLSEIRNRGRLEFPVWTRPHTNKGRSRQEGKHS